MWLKRTREPVQVFRFRVVSKVCAPLDSVDIAIVGGHATRDCVSSIRDTRPFVCPRCVDSTTCCTDKCTDICPYRNPCLERNEMGELLLVNFSLGGDETLSTTSSEETRKDKVVRYVLQLLSENS